MLNKLFAQKLRGENSNEETIYENLNEQGDISEQDYLTFCEPVLGENEDEKRKTRVRKTIFYGTTPNEQEKSYKKDLKCPCGYRSETYYWMKKHIAQQHEGQNVKFVNMASKWQETRTSIERSLHQSYKRITLEQGNNFPTVFKCSLCDKSFYTEQKLKEHGAIVHEGKKLPIHFNTKVRNKIHPCAECGERFSMKSYLNLHR